MYVLMDFSLTLIWESVLNAHSLFVLLVTLKMAVLHVFQIIIS
jgi:hypothetical protein